MSEKKLNILFLSSWYPNRLNPTIGNFVQKHAESVALHANVTVLHVCFDKNIPNKSETEIIVRNNLTEYLVYIKKPSVKIPLVFCILKLFKTINAYQRIFNKIFQQGKPDLIHANVIIPISLIAYWFYLTKRIPFVITEHWTGYLPNDPNKPGKSLLFYRFFAGKARYLMPVTENLAGALKNYGIKGKYRIIPNVVDTNLFYPLDKPSRNITEILHISSLYDRQKNFSGILQALKIVSEVHQDFRLHVISDGNHSCYMDLITKLGLDSYILFHGIKNTAEVAEIMQQNDFLILFSNFENFPCVIPEAWASGIPVLSSDVGGISEFITKENGVLVSPGNVDEFAEALIQMIYKHKEFDKQLIREHAEKNFSYHNIGMKYLNLYKTIINP